MRSIARWCAVSLVVSIVSPAVGVAQEAARLKIGVVNYGMIYANYDRAKDVKRDLDTGMLPFKQKVEIIKIGIKDLQTMLENPKLSPEAAAGFRTQLKAKADELTEIDKKARSEVISKHEKTLVLIWKEIKDAVADQANKRDFDLVLGYGETPTTTTDTVANINRKMGVMELGALTPVFVRNGVDITADVVNTLNENFRKESKAKTP